MAAGDPIFTNLPVNRFWEQAGSGFDEAGAGTPDIGERVILTRADTRRDRWPQRGNAHPSFRRMFVQSVRDTLLECRLIELRVSYLGALKGDQKPHRLTPGVDVQMFQFPAIDGALNVRWVAPVPQPTLMREYVSFIRPDYANVGKRVAADYLPPPPEFTLFFVPDPDQPLTRNLLTGWVLVGRTWADDAIGAWHVTEYYAFYNTLA